MEIICEIENDWSSTKTYSSMIYHCDIWFRVWAIPGSFSFSQIILMLFLKSFCFHFDLFRYWKTRPIVIKFNFFLLNWSSHHCVSGIWLYEKRKVVDRYRIFVPRTIITSEIVRFVLICFLVRNQALPLNLASFHQRIARHPWRNSAITNSTKLSDYFSAYTSTRSTIAINITT